MNPKVFISYSQDDDIYKDWVKNFADRLIRDGIEVTLDQYDLQLGAMNATFMETGVRDNEFVIILVTKKYAEKANARKGGVGYETDLTTGEIIMKENRRKFIPIMICIEYNEAPSYLKGANALKINSLFSYEEAYEKLYAALTEQNPIKPQLGKIRKISPGTGLAELDSDIPKLPATNEIAPKENTSKGEIVRTHCNKCGRIINHKILVNYYVSGTEVLCSDFDFRYGRRDYTADYKNDYQIIECFGCNSITYRTDRYFSEVQDDDNDGTWEERFPTKNEKQKKNYKHLPPTLMKIYEEVIVAYNHDCFILCSAGVRAMIDGICTDKGITDGSLQNKIEKMREEKFINPQHENILHKLRFLGNEALHALQSPSQEEINTAVDIIEHIIESLYEILGKAEILRESK